MAPSESRPITRPRLSLSCVVCRRRKVRCGREQPACGNCVRINEACEYEADALDRFRSQARRPSTPNNSREEASTSRSDPAPSEDAWAKWTERNNIPEYSLQTGREEASADRSQLPKIGTAPHDTSTSASTSTSSPYYLGDSSTLGKSHVSPPTPAPSRGIPFTFAARDASQSSSTAPVPKHQRLGSGALRKRSRSVVHSTPQRELSKDDFCLQDGYLPCSSTSMGNPAAEETDTPNVGYLSVRSGGQVRYVGGAFWGLISGLEDLCESFLGEDYELSENMPPPCIDSPGLANLLNSLPTKAVCDRFFWSFLVGVYPVHPLIHVSTFRSDYNRFWQWCQNSDTSLPSKKLLEDPTYLCLLFSVLYCGAATAPLSMWGATELQGLQKEMVVEQLKTAFATSLKMCQHLQHPTFDTLVASLLGHSCLGHRSDPAEDVRFVSMIIRIAQSMGLHRESTLFHLDEIACELRRRVWWHIVWLDVQASILNGSQTCLEPQHEVRMVAETRDEDLCKTSGTGPLTPVSTPPFKTNSIMMLFAVGHCETAKFNHFLISYLRSTRAMGQAQCDDLVNAVRKLHFKIDTLIARIPAQGFPERGLIPSRLANASPLTHEELYSDHATQPTVFTSWTRIMLTMLKAESAILLQKSFLGRGNLKSKQRMWDSIVQVCISYLRNFLQLTRIPAFAPYAWFYYTHHASLQCVFIILAYLQRNRHGDHAHLARYFVDEVIDVYAPDEQSRVYSKEGHVSPRPTIKSGNQSPPAWRLLVALRQKLDSPLEIDRLPFKPTTPSRYQPASPAVSLAPEFASERPNFTAIPPSLSNWERDIPDATLAFPSSDPLVTCYQDEHGGEPHVNSLLDLSDLVGCSSLLAQFTDAYVPNGQDSERSADAAVIAAFSASTTSPRFQSEGIGDMLDKWHPIDESRKRAATTETRARTANTGDSSRESRNEGDNKCAELFADFVDETMDERLWMD